MVALCLLVFLALGGYVTEGKHIHSVMGPFDVVFKSIDPCGTEISGEDQIHVYITPNYDRKTKQKIFHGNFTLGIPIDDNVGATLDLATSDPVGGWKPHAVILPIGPAATGLKTYIPEIATYVLNNLDGGPYSLPSKAGTYTFSRLSLDGFGHSFSRKFPVFLYGDYRADVILYDIHKGNKAVKGCVRMSAAVVPKM